MRVLHLCRSFSVLTETFIYDYVTEQVRQDVDAHVLTHNRVNADTRPFDNVTVVPWPSIWHPKRLGYRLLEVLGQREPRTSFWSVLRPALQTEIQRLAPDVIHAHFGRPAAMIAPLAAQMDVPLVATFYGYDLSELPQQARWRRAYRPVWRTARAIVVLSDEMRRRAVDAGAPPERTRVVRLARDLEAFPFRSPTPPIRTFVSVGRLTDKKGHGDAIQAVDHVVQAGGDVELRIIGDGDRRAALTREVARRNLQGRVTLLGRLPNEGVQDELRAADAFLLCSKTAPSGDREGTPTVLIEAQASGLPCISTRHAGIPEMIPEANHALLAEPGDVDGLAARIRRLQAASDEDLRQIAAAGRKKVEADFNLSEEVRALRRIYAEVAGAAVSAS